MLCWNIFIILHTLKSVVVTHGNESLIQHEFEWNDSFLEMADMRGSHKHDEEASKVAFLG